jgi:long-chain acyl-CoA synthetase
MLEIRAISHKNNIAFYQKGKDKTFQTITYNQLKEDVDSLGTALLEMGLKGKKIAIIGKNRYEWVVSYLATICGVGIVVPLDKELADNEIINCINRVDVDTIFYSKEFEKRLNNISGDIPVNNYISMDDGELSINNLIANGKKLLEEGNRTFLDSKINNLELATLIFTSGTTSASKIVMLSHKNMLSNVKAGQMMVKVDETDIFFSFLPLNHTLECTCSLLYPLASGSAIAYGDGLMNVSKDMKTIKPTTIMVVPRVAEVFYEKIIKGIEKQNKVKNVKIAMKLTNLLGKRGISLKKKIFREIHDELGGNLKLIMMGGAPVNPKVLKYFRDLGISALQGYGLTECAPLVTLNSDASFKDDSTGLVMPGSEVRIANPDEFGIGEIIVKGPQVMLGYYGDEEATNNAIKDGFLYTGDLGKFDNEGFLKLSGRSKNVIIASNGKNIFPEEIEFLINENPLIKETVVYGSDNFNNKGRLTAEVVVIDELKQKIADNPEYKEELKKMLLDYLKEVNKKLSEYKRVHELEIRQTDFEKTSTLKVKRFSVRKQN